MSDQTNPQAGDEAIDDLDVPADEADAVTGGFTLRSSEDSEPASSTQAQKGEIA